jgi:hypothetical protein
LVRELTTDAALRGKVIPLAFHVDYWDRLGWRDPFSAADWTRRQQVYAAALHLPSAYTPQMVVNGTRQFVGSNGHALDAALADETKQPPFGTVSVSATRDGHALAAKVTATAPSSANVVLAVFENGLVTKVEAGENSGWTIDNEAVVRRLVKVAAGSVDTTVSIPLDKSWNPAHLGVAAFLQDRKTMAIRGAAVAAVR